MPITQNEHYLNARGGLVTEEQFDLLAAPLGRIYSFDDVAQMVLDQCALEGFVPGDDDLISWTHAVIGAAVTVAISPTLRRSVSTGREGGA